MKKTIVTILAAGVVAGGFYTLAKQDEGCINVYVDYGKLDNGAKLTKCVDVSTKTGALDILKGAGLNLEGTKKYGDGVICRVDGLPDAKVESCQDMPPAKAYWAIIIKEKKVIPFPKSEWGWGQLAVDQQYLNPGDSIGLVWTGPNGELRFP